MLKPSRRKQSVDALACGCLLESVMLSPRGQTVLEAEILSSASTSCPRPHPRASGLGMSSDFVTWPRAYMCISRQSPSQF